MIDIKNKIRQLINNEITEFTIIELVNHYCNFKDIEAVNEDGKVIFYNNIARIPTSVKFRANKLKFTLEHRSETAYRPETILIRRKYEYELSADTWEEFMMSLNIRGISYMDCVDNCTSGYRTEKMETVDINKIITNILREEFLMPKSYIVEDYLEDSAAASA